MARSKRKIPKNYKQESRNFILEKGRIGRHFPCFQCNLIRKRLICHGTILPSEGCDTYKVKIVYKEGGIPRVYIIEPYIEPNRIYHIYREGNLCLYDYRESPWSNKMKIHETIIPWIAEWLVYYEMWKFTNEWLGPEAKHGLFEKRPEEEKR